MRGKPLAVILSSFLVIAIIGGFAFLVTTRHETNGANNLAQATATLTPDPYGCNMPLQGTPVAGTPAITPKNNGTIAFSEQDVKDYVSRPEQGAKNIVIDNVQFMTSAQACIALGGVESGIAPEAMVCLIRFHGENTTAAGGGTFKDIYIFDAHTGNILVAHLGV